MNDFLMERNWYAVSPDGVGAELNLCIAAPLKNHIDWCCAVSLGVLDTHPSTIYGIDSWHAVQMAILFITRRVTHFSDAGWLFYWDKDGERVMPSALIDSGLRQFT
ncbi:hypothetical protein LPB67_03625 [Undibacterium sp. Jales W-56]|uniref:hypothetical protein n=1 Tax=Undibacterium sp. Jales W-56 TaxID=2897325 RepID=UPI0021D1E57A|nr:hypothetical protein [Undibacterium sp. Jales W-56]MCU6432868.1 hypothetical protein [Undibacterium sp. Jales W-56]